MLGEPAVVARAPQSVTVRLADDLDVSRGDLLVPVADAPRPVREIEATACHLHERPLVAGQRVLLKHATRTVQAVVREVRHRLTPETLERSPAPGGLEMNDIGGIVLRTAEPVPVDAYAESRATGSLLLIDPGDGSTLTAAMALP